MFTIDEAVEIFFSEIAFLLLIKISKERYAIEEIDVCKLFSIDLDGV